MKSGAYLPYCAHLSLPYDNIQCRISCRAILRKLTGIKFGVLRTLQLYSYFLTSVFIYLLASTVPVLAVFLQQQQHRWPNVIVILNTHFLLVQLLSLACSSSMSAFRLPALRYAFGNTSLLSSKAIQRRHAQVHDVRFLVTHRQPQRLVEEKYKEKLQQKAKE